MASLLIGHTGFIGSNLLTQREWDVKVNRKNSYLLGGHFDLVVCCAAPGVKWKANEYPEGDLHDIRMLVHQLREITAYRFVLISTADVFAQPVDATEAHTPHPDCPYGRNRLYLEEQVRRLFPRGTVVRLPGVKGPGLKKNALYDLQHEQLLDKLNPESVYQWYDVRNLWADVERYRNVPLIHLCPPPESLAETVERDYPHLKGKLTGAGTPARYNLRTLYS